MPRDRLLVATYNLLHGMDPDSGRVDLDAVATVIAGLGADVVGLQEVDRLLPRSGTVDQTAWLAERLGWHGVFVPALLGDPDERWTRVPAEDPGGPAYGLSLLAARPLTGARRVDLPSADIRRAAYADAGRPRWDPEPRVALEAHIDVEDVRVRVVTAHLSYLPWRGVAQLRAAAAAAVGDGGPVVLLGDFNLPRWSVELLLVPPWSHAGGGATFPSRRPVIQIDQVVVHGGPVVVGAAVGPVSTSDHRPLRATLELVV
ncbi:MAG TPA: endonuclease/exonuclease/phosphatase family protein [Egibacteraceae bacterium]|nr:endonuclease/exonuclease/phosphatase family protein [Egibacteraceae bacterium]